VIAYVLPTFNRSAVLDRTLAALGALPAHDAEVIIVDNASTLTPNVPRLLDNGLPVSLILRAQNEGAAARNAGVRASEPLAEWVVMLDDDSYPTNLDFLNVLRRQPDDVVAVMADIFLPCGERESGGLPEVFIGCGTAIRRDAFLHAGGYDHTFHYYVEEYDLAAKLMLQGGRIVMDRAFTVVHEKTQANRNMQTILQRLVRNNAWIMQRYAPESVRKQELHRTIRRYGRIATKERARRGYWKGRLEWMLSRSRQPRSEMSAELWDRFTGKAACRRGLLRAWATSRFDSAGITSPGKNEHIVAECLAEMGVRIVDEREAEVLVAGTLSPGPMLDALATIESPRRVIAPWTPDDSRNVAQIGRVAA
jgi:GT2 family glycosyltransferase